MRLLYGTENAAKIKHMRNMLQGLNIEIVDPSDINIKVDKVVESGNSPVENAQIKAMAYYNATKMPSFSCDSGLFIDGIPDDIQPGVHIRRVNGKVLNDDEMIEYYSNLALQNGGELKAKYRNAIVLVLDHNNIITYDGDDISSVEFLITSKPHAERNPGFPLDSISLEITSKRYYMDIGSKRGNSDNKLAQGFRNFFIKHVLEREKVITFGY